MHLVPQPAHSAEARVQTRERRPVVSPPMEREAVSTETRRPSMQLYALMACWARIPRPTLVHAEIGPLVERT